MPVLFSVIIPFYNQAPFLKYSSDSLIAQHYPYREVIIINDGSTNNTNEIATQYSRKTHKIKIFLKQEIMAFNTLNEN